MYVGRKTGLLLSAILGHSGLTAQAPGTGLPVMIFFDSGKSEIRREWAETLDEAIPALLKQPDSVITIGGHSDRSGSSSANRHSSLRRAEAVRDYLTARGVPSRAIAVRAFGEDQPLVATADGVREPQNRRVDIHLSSLPGR